MYGIHYVQYCSVKIDGKKFTVQDLEISKINTLPFKFILKILDVLFSQFKDYLLRSDSIRFNNR